jgi:hypothetical protein
MTAEHIPTTSHLSLAPGIPLAVEEAGPEQLLISALLDTGAYDPISYGIPDQAIVAHREVHNFCAAYQEREGCAPPLHLVLDRFPSFPFMAGVGARWAASEVAKAETNRTLRKELTRASMAVRDEAHGEAVQIMREAIAKVTTGSAPGTKVTDLTALAAAMDDLYCPIPPGVLAEATGGHAAGELWLIAAVWGVGKSWKLLEHADAAAEAGWDVHIYSCEMSTAKMLNRFHKIALRDWARPPFDTISERQEAIDAWQEGAGQVSIFGPERGRVDASVVSSAIAHRRTLVVIDYIGRMYTTAGVPAKEDYRSQSVVSQELAEVASYRQVPVLAAAQLNRVGDLAGSMDLERDADLILELQRVSETCDSVRKNILKKIRDGEKIAPWYTRFQAGMGRFGDISGDEAFRMKAEEEAMQF